MISKYPSPILWSAGLYSRELLGVRFSVGSALICSAAVVGVVVCQLSCLLRIFPTPLLFTSFTKYFFLSFKTWFTSVSPPWADFSFRAFYWPRRPLSHPVVTFTAGINSIPPFLRFSSLFPLVVVNGRSKDFCGYFVSFRSWSPGKNHEGSSLLPLSHLQQRISVSWPLRDLLSDILLLVVSYPQAAHYPSPHLEGFSWGSSHFI